MRPVVAICRRSIRADLGKSDANGALPEWMLGFEQIGHGGMGKGDC